MPQALFALLMVGLAVAFFVEASQYPASAAQMPRLLACVVGLLAAMMMIQPFVSRRPKPETAPELPVHAAQAKTGGSILRGALFFVLICIFIAVFPYLGFIPASVAFMLLAIAASRGAGLIGTIVATVSLTGVVYGVFVLFLRLPVPLWPNF